MRKEVRKGKIGLKNLFNFLICTVLTTGGKKGE